MEMACPYSVGLCDCPDPHRRPYTRGIESVFRTLTFVLTGWHGDEADQRGRGDGELAEQFRGAGCDAAGLLGRRPGERGGREEREVAVGAPTPGRAKGRCVARRDF
jgi:hypothetical protein